MASYFERSSWFSFKFMSMVHYIFIRVYVSIHVFVYWMTELTLTVPVTTIDALRHFETG